MEKYFVNIFERFIYSIKTLLDYKQILIFASKPNLFFITQ